ncbi:hypothetical protein FQN54_009860 [Arachnomyces sp. PD_36]|nr:hypothetical protein FQN54_009860 [Arachnomyces sp. PD_36]
MTRDAEKDALGTEHLDDAGSGASQVDIDVDEEFTYKEQRKIIHRVDRRLVTICGLSYCISLMDRTNLSNAAIAGMTKELELEVGFRYSIIVLVFFVPYVCFQIPATAVIRRLGPRNFLSAIVLTWGVMMIGFGFTNNWEQLAALRVVLGILEAGFFPGCVYLLSTWYSRYDTQKRYSFFYFIGSFASALTGILAFGFMQLEGREGMMGWRWIFILEGVLTGVVAILCYIFLVDFPDQGHKAWGFLNERESAFIIRRLNRDRGDANVEPFNLRKYLRPCLDLKVCSTTLSYAIAYFLPIILESGMGFGTGESQCLVAPPYAFAGLVMMTTAYFSDKYKIRSPFIVLNAVLALIGLPLMGWAESNAVRYFGVFLTTAGANANVPAAMGYQANNIRGQWKRALCSATLVGLGGVGGIAGSLVFRSQDSPEYYPGIYACLA